MFFVIVLDYKICLGTLFRGVIPYFNYVTHMGVLQF